MWFWYFWQVFFVFAKMTTITRIFSTITQIPLNYHSTFFNYHSDSQLSLGKCKRKKTWFLKMQNSGWYTYVRSVFQKFYIELFLVHWVKCSRIGLINYVKSTGCSNLQVKSSAIVRTRTKRTLKDAFEDDPINRNDIFENDFFFG